MLWLCVILAASASGISVTFWKGVTVNLLLRLPICNALPHAYYCKFAVRNSLGL